MAAMANGRTRDFLGLKEKIFNFITPTGSLTNYLEFFVKL